MFLLISLRQPYIIIYTNDISHKKENRRLSMERVILYYDINNFYASVEIKLNPQLKGKAITVGGSGKDRDGIVLAKSYEAKLKGVKTGESLMEARKKCPELSISYGIPAFKLKGRNLVHLGAFKDHWSFFPDLLLLRLLRVGCLLIRCLRVQFGFLIP